MKGSFDDINGGSVAESERWRWSSHKKFVLVTLGGVEGPGNLCVYPLYLRQNGKGAILIPYILFKIFFVIPITYMQLALGQYSEKGSVDVWMLCPLAQGLGYAMAVLGVYFLLYNNTIIMFSLYYLFSSFQSRLPWSHCDHDWAMENCVVRSLNTSTIAKCIKRHSIPFCKDLHWESSAQHFWLVRILGFVPGHDVVNNGIGTFNVGLILCLLLSCFCSFVATARGLKNIEKMANFTTIYPFVGITALLLTTFLDKGSAIGLEYLVHGKWKILSDYKVWVLAFNMAIQSMSLSTGVLISMGSYCTFRSPAHMDAIYLNLIDIIACVACNVLCFNCIGIIAHHFALDAESVVPPGHNIPFVIIPEALAFIPGPTHFWSFILFSSISCFGITTQYILMATNFTFIYDRFPNTMQYSAIVSGVVNILLFLSGLPLCTSNGFAFAGYFANFIAGLLQSSVLFVQLFVVMWIYALSRFSDDVHFMLGFRPSNVILACWILAPLITVIMWVSEYKVIQEKLVGFHLTIFFVTSMVMYNIAMGIVALVAVINLVIYFKNNKLRQVLKAVPEWGPVDPVLIKSRRMFNAQAMTKEYMYRQSRRGAHARKTSQQDSDSEHD